MTQSTAPQIMLNDGHAIPQLGFGVWQVPEDQVVDAVKHALATGYRHLDTAAAYGNEEGVGQALAESDVARDEVFVTTKLWNDAHGRDRTLRAFDTSMDKLGLDVLDDLVGEFRRNRIDGGGNQLTLVPYNGADVDRI